MTAALLAMQPQPIPFLPSQTFQCNRKQVVLTPSACSNFAALSTISPDGTATKSEVIDSRQYQ